MTASMNWPRFRHVSVWDMGREIMKIEFRVVEGCPWLTEEWTTQDSLRHGRPYTLEIIVRGVNGVHHFEDCICEGDIKPTRLWSDRCEIGRYVYDWSDTGKGDDFVISNDHCSVTINIDRTNFGFLRSSVIDQRVFVKRPQWGRLWRRPKPLAA
jgi:hypothetical protein